MTFDSTHITSWTTRLLVRGLNRMVAANFRNKTNPIQASRGCVIWRESVEFKSASPGEAKLTQAGWLSIRSPGADIFIKVILLPSAPGVTGGASRRNASLARQRTGMG
jgi:hypothetical protein